MLLLSIWITILQITVAKIQNEDPIGFCTTDVKVLKKNVNSDYVIGGLFPIHINRNDKYDLFSIGFLWSLTMVFAIDEINKDKTLLPNVTLGYELYDTCGTALLATDATIRITRKRSVQNKTNLEKCICETDSKPVFAIIGDGFSSTAIRVASIASALKTTQVSYAATSIELSSKQLYPTFLRTIPPDYYQAFALTKLMVEFNWDYVNVVACDDNYGRVGSQALIEQLNQHNICVAVNELYDVKNDKNGVTTSLVIKKLIEQRQATVIILWCVLDEALKVIRKAEELNLHHRTWIATETFSTSDELLKINPNVIRGMLGVRISQKLYPPFEKFLREQEPGIKTNNPWLNKYWEMKGCKLSGDRYQCSETGINLFDLPRNEYLNVLHSTYAVAAGLQDYLMSNKNNKENDLDNEIVFEYIKNVKFTDKNNFTISFNEDGNPGLVRYTIVNIIRGAKENYFQNIGTYDGESLKLENKDLIKFSSHSKPASTCKERCAPGYSKVSFGSQPCCSNCIKCPPNTVQSNYDQNDCLSCQDDLMANQNQTKCLKPDLEYFHITEPLNIVLVMISIFSAIIILCSIFVIIKYQNTPIVKAINFKLSLLQLFSMFALIGLPIISFSFKQDSTICKAQLSYFMFNFVIAISVTFSKADLLLRIFKASKSGVLLNRKRIRGNKLEYINVIGLIAVGLLLCSFLFFTMNSDSKIRIINTSLDNITIDYHCAGQYDTLLFLLLAYLVLIALLCGVYAFKARKLPASYNEGNYSSFSMFIFILTWLAFIPLYMGTDSYSTKLIIWCYISLVTNMSVFALMYVPKLIIVLFKPKKNNRERFRRHINVQNSAESHDSNL